MSFHIESPPKGASYNDALFALCQAARGKLPLEVIQMHSEKITNIVAEMQMEINERRREEHRSKHAKQLQGTIASLSPEQEEKAKKDKRFGFKKGMAEGLRFMAGQYAEQVEGLKMHSKLFDLAGAPKGSALMLEVSQTYDRWAKETLEIVATETEPMEKQNEKELGSS